jgi:hypothetical protein
MLVELIEQNVRVVERNYSSLPAQRANLARGSGEKSLELQLLHGHAMSRQLDRRNHQYRSSQQTVAELQYDHDLCGWMGSYPQPHTGSWSACHNQSVPDTAAASSMNSLITLSCIIVALTASIDAAQAVS